jgi:hypothetical protein
MRSVELEATPSVEFDGLPNVIVFVHFAIVSDLVRKRDETVTAY